MCRSAGSLDEEIWIASVARPTLIRICINWIGRLNVICLAVICIETTNTTKIVNEILLIASLAIPVNR